MKLFSEENGVYEILTLLCTNGFTKLEERVSTDWSDRKGTVDHFLTMVKKVSSPMSVHKV